METIQLTLPPSAVQAQFKELVRRRVRRYPDDAVESSCSPMLMIRRVERPGIDVSVPTSSEITHRHVAAHEHRAANTWRLPLPALPTRWRGADVD